MTKRILLFLLVLSLLLAVSCNQAQTPTTDTTTNSDTSDTTDTSDTSGTTPKPGYTDWPLQEFIVRAIVQTQNKNSFEADRDGTALNEAIYQRNENLEDQLDARITYEITVGNSSRNALYDEMQSLKDGYSYDVISTATYRMVRLAVEGMLHDLASQDSIKLNEEFYDDGYNDALNVGGRQYLATGQFTLSWYRYQIVCLFNRNVFKDAEVNYPYEDVLAQQWTAEKMMQYSAKLYRDTNQNGAYDANDRFGLFMYVGSGSSQIDGFIPAFNLRLIEKDADGYFKMIDINPSTWGSAIEDFVELFQGNGAWCKNDIGNIGVENKFTANEAGLICYRMHVIENEAMIQLGRTEEGYGILPLPKANSTQENYNSYITAELLTFGIPNTVYEGNDLDDTSLFFHSLAAESYKTVSSAYTGMIDERSKPMVDIIESGVVVDPVDVYYNTYFPLVTGSFRAVYDGTKTVSEILEGKQGQTFEESLNTLNQALRDLDAALKEKEQRN